MGDMEDIGFMVHALSGEPPECPKVLGLISVRKNSENKNLCRP